MIQKNELRSFLRKKRKEISSSRRAEASAALVDSSKKWMKQKGGILSFSSLIDEIDLSALNLILSAQGKLFLPRIEEGSLSPYRIDNLETQLTRSTFGILEPDPDRCEKGTFSEIALILVPGLGFDAAGFRIGYGYGHYDRFLSLTKDLHSIGVGFKEQEIKSIPLDPWDLPVKELLLF